MGILGDDETAAIAAAQAAGQADDGRWRGVASQTPGTGWAPQLPQPPSSAGGYQVLPVTGEGYASAPAAQPRQVKSVLGVVVSGVTPSYGGPEVSGQHFSYGPRHVQDMGDGRLMIGQRSEAPGAVVIPVSPAVEHRSVLGRLLGRLRRK